MNHPRISPYVVGALKEAQALCDQGAFEEARDELEQRLAVARIYSCPGRGRLIRALAKVKRRIVWEHEQEEPRYRRPIA